MPVTNGERHNRVMLLLSPATYRANAFIAAAQRLHLETVSVTDLPRELAEHYEARLAVNFNNPNASVEKIIELVAETPVDAILSVDDSATELAALANARLGLPNNSPDSATAARDKHVMRTMLKAGGAPCPFFDLYPADIDPADVAEAIAYPCVIKPRRLSGSRGVIRGNNPQEFVIAFERVKRMLLSDGFELEKSSLLVEEFLPGVEVALEGLLTNGSLQVLTLFDKPDPLDGPFFEETIYVTPSRLSADVQQAIADATAAGAAALGLQHGPIHAELRINERGPWIIEMAGRSIGGLCSTILEFGSGVGLEEIILRHAVGMNIPTFQRSGSAVGVMMIPIPKAGRLRACRGVEEALQVSGINGIEITAKMNYPIVPLPEGSSYLGFIFAQGTSPEEVEQSIREAHSRLSFQIDTLIPLIGNLENARAQG
ncbi:ATP-grasp domain-containing protein [soil metagenome]